MEMLRMLHGGDEDTHGELAGARIGNVIGAAAAIAAITLLGLKLPSLITRWGGGSKASLRKRQLLETLLTAFAAGSFWGLALMHMLLEAVTLFASLEWGIYIGLVGDEDDHTHLSLGQRLPRHGDSEDDHHHHDHSSYFNPAYIFCVGGYLLMLGIQNFAVVLNNKNKVSMKDKSNRSSENADAIISCLALTVHALFEGIVVGLADANSLIWVAAVAIMGHKWAEAFALAQSMRTRDCNKGLRLTLLSIFFLASPVGAICGLFIASFNGGVVVASLTAVSSGVLVFVAGHCTEDVFGGHCHSTDAAAISPHAEHAEESDHSGHVVADLESNTRHLRDTHTHGHGASHCGDKSAADFSASASVFAGRMILMTAGAGLVFGMMCLHMINPGHTH